MHWQKTKMDGGNKNITQRLQLQLEVVSFGFSKSNKLLHVNVNKT